MPGLKQHTGAMANHCGLIHLPVPRVTASPTTNTNLNSVPTTSNILLPATIQHKFNIGDKITNPGSSSNYYAIVKDVGMMEGVFRYTLEQHDKISQEISIVYSLVSVVDATYQKLL